MSVHLADRPEICQVRYNTDNTAVVRQVFNDSIILIPKFRASNIL